MEGKAFIVIMEFYFQDGLRRRMDKLKTSIEEGNQAVDRERQKNVSLLHLIFPPNIAKRLWLGELCPWLELFSNQDLQASPLRPRSTAT